MHRGDSKTVLELYEKLEKVQINWICTDDWSSFKAVFPATKHLIGKACTKNIEGINTAIRTFVRRVFRKTTCFSKKLDYHMAAFKLFFYHRNEGLFIIH